MPLFKRKPKALPQKEPDVYVSYSSNKQGLAAIRVYFLDELWPTSEIKQTREEALALSQKRMELFEKLQQLTGADQLNPHRQYIALHWFAPNAPGEDVEAAVIAVLAEYFGWNSPLVGYFDYPSEEKYRVEKHCNVYWSPSS